MLSNEINVVFLEMCLLIIVVDDLLCLPLLLVFVASICSRRIGIDNQEGLISHNFRFAFASRVS